jgi:hypothetical protein
MQPIALLPREPSDVLVVDAIPPAAAPAGAAAAASAGARHGDRPAAGAAVAHPIVAGADAAAGMQTLLVAPFVAGQHSDDPSLALLAEAVEAFAAERQRAERAPAAAAGGNAAAAAPPPKQQRPGGDSGPVSITAFMASLRDEGAAAGLRPRTGRPVDDTVAVFGAVLARLRRQAARGSGGTAPAAK